MDRQQSGALFGLASAFSWGAGDFSGGVASKRGRVFAVVLASDVIGSVLLVGLAVLLSEPLPALGDLMWASAAGISGTIGLVCLYRAMAVGGMGVATPISAVVTAGVPVLWGMAAEGMPTGSQMLGFGLALTAVWLVSRSGKGGAVRVRDLGLPMLAGLGFGVFLILIDHVSEASVAWPLVFSRGASIVALVVVIAAMRSRRWPDSRQLPLAALAGFLDTAGNAFYALASRLGRLDVAAVLSSLGPAVTVLLARFVLKEAISRRQWLGVLAALAAVVLIAS